MSSVVVDASALLALLNDEPGHAAVSRVLSEASISAVNLAEVVGKLIERGGAKEVVRRALSSLPLTVVPFDEEQAYEAGGLRGDTQRLGLSLGDCVCLALSKRLAVPAYTGDRTWAELRVGVEVVLIRD